MLRVTTLLIVMVLAAGPTSSLVCDVWCSTPAAEDHHQRPGCHDASGGSMDGQRVAAAGRCDDAGAFTPFLTEARQIDPGRGTIPAAVLQLHSIVPDVDRVIARWRVLQLQPHRGPLLHPVLRI
jgi:hypothetical protein